MAQAYLRCKKITPKPQRRASRTASPWLPLLVLRERAGVRAPLSRSACRGIGCARWRASGTKALMFAGILFVAIGRVSRIAPAAYAADAPATAPAQTSSDAVNPNPYLTLMSHNSPWRNSCGRRLCLSRGLFVVEAPRTVPELRESSLLGLDPA